MFTTTPLDTIAPLVTGLRERFDAGHTTSARWRRTALEQLRSTLIAHEGRLATALRADLGKPAFEGWLTEIAVVVNEIDHLLAHLDTWMRPEKVPTPMAGQPGSSRLVREPLGVVCVIAPWNYPVQLTISPLAAAIAAGNAVVVKPSELAPATADALGALIAELGDPAIAMVQGGVAETTELLAQRFDHIIYTGGARVARVVMKAAAEHLTPVTLELGGKSPAIVSAKADVAVAAKRIAWGKFLNAGQTCIAPDYVLVDRSVHDDLVAGIGRAITEFYGADPATSADYGRIVNAPHFHRLEKLLDSGSVAHGGVTDADQRYISPTVLTGVTEDDPVMAEEIFGPILPVLAVDSLQAAIDVVARRSREGDKPLALYTFSEDGTENDAVIAGTTSGGVCVNGTLLHIGNPNLPFGGVGESGMGAYHGRFGFDTFSHVRGVYERSTRVDPPLTYPPYTAKRQRLVRRAMSMPDPRTALHSLASRLRRR